MPQFIPIKQSAMNVTLGIGVPIGRRSHRIAAHVYTRSSSNDETDLQLGFSAGGAVEVDLRP